MNKLKASSIPIHAYFVDKAAEDNFKEIASETGGKCEFLDVNSAAGAEILTNLITE